MIRFLIAMIMAIDIFAQTIKIAEYNVENLFDLQRSGYEYKEYIPNTKANWNLKTYRIKLEHTARVIKDLDADIVALCEVESLIALKDLRKVLQQKGVYYKYFGIANQKKTTVKVAYLSKIKPIYTKEIWVGRSYKYRNILEVKFKDFYLFINHWKSKSGGESHRIKSAKALKKRLESIGYDKNFILTGDFNSDYEEYKKFVRKRRLNDTNGKTGINHILNTYTTTTQAKDAHLQGDALYNLWYDLPQEQRWNYIHRGKKENLDSIIISAPVLQRGGFDYVYNSFGVLKKGYLFYKKRINKWYMRYSNKGARHMGKGYSDHLPIYAKFKLP
jgi:endonuclease/exonuclease/phosphatase family metal-dependent hydrolase